MEDLVVRQGVAADHPHRPGRRRQEPARGRGRGQARPASSPTGCGSSISPPSRPPDLVPAAIAAGLGLNTSGGRLCTDVMSYLRTQAAPAGPGQFRAGHRGGSRGRRTAGRRAGPGDPGDQPDRAPGQRRVRAACSAARGPAVPGRRDTSTCSYSSVRLFMARAGAAAPGFELTSTQRRGHRRDLPQAGRPAAGHRARGRPDQAAAPAVRCWPGSMTG